MNRCVASLSSLFSSWIRAIYLALMATQAFGGEPKLLAKLDAFSHFGQPGLLALCR